MRANAVWMLLVAMLAPGCAAQIVQEGLAADNPACVDAPVGVAPVPIGNLTIAQTGLSPVATPAVQPDPHLSKVDMSWVVRWFPFGMSPMTPAQTPEAHEDAAEDLYVPDVGRAGKQRRERQKGLDLEGDE